MMARYFFDIDDGVTKRRDASGIDLAGPETLPAEAFNLLRLLVQDKMPEGRPTFVVQVRDEAGAVAYRGEMTIDGRRFRP